MARARVERFAGVPLRVNGLPTGLFAGGGWRGITPKLDRAVERAAQELARGLRCRMQIRFNSNRLTGGAWLGYDLSRLDANFQAGIGAGYVEIWPEDTPYLTWQEIPFEKRKKRFYIESRISARLLNRPELANKEVGTGDAECRRPHKSVERAVRWVLKAIDRKKLQSCLRKARRLNRQVETA